MAAPNSLAAAELIQPHEGLASGTRMLGTIESGAYQ